MLTAEQSIGICELFDHEISFDQNEIHRGDRQRIKERLRELEHTDKRAEVKGRVEQYLLKKGLFGGAYQKEGIGTGCFYYSDETRAFFD